MPSTGTDEQSTADPFQQREGGSRPLGGREIAALPANHRDGQL
jgi:hypothetical protein